MQSTKKKKRARTLLQLATLLGVATVSAQGCSDPFSSCVETRSCDPEDTGGTGGADDGGQGGASEPHPTTGGAGGANSGGAAAGADVPTTGGASTQGTAGASSEEGGAGASNVGGQATGGGTAGETATGSGGTATASGGNAGGTAAGGTAADLGGMVGTGGTNWGAGGNSSGVAGARGGDSCMPNVDKALCSELYPGIARCGGKRVLCPSDGRWPLTSEACVPSGRDCKSTDDADCDGVRDNTTDATCPCTPGSYVGCYLPNDSGCQRGISACVGEASAPTSLPCALPPEGTALTYPANRVFCPNNALLGAACTTTAGLAKTLVSQCATKTNTCGILYCM